MLYWFPRRVAPENLDLRLEQVWAPAREMGALGAAAVSALRRHSAGFIAPRWGSERDVSRFVDIGSGVGVPGLLLAIELPWTRWLLIDAEQRRCDLAHAAVEAVGLGDRVTVEHIRAEDLARRPAARGQFDGATARLLGSPAEAAECGLPLLAMGGTLVVSVSEATEAVWRSVALQTLTGCVVSDGWSTPEGQYLAIERVSEGPDSIPRRPAARRRVPLF